MASSQRSNAALWEHFNSVLNNEQQEHLGRPRAQAVRENLPLSIWPIRNVDPDWLPDQQEISPTGSDIEEEEEDEFPTQSFKMGGIEFKIKKTFFKSNESFR